MPLPEGDLKTAFCYCDPPYLDTDHHYQSGFTKKNSEDLFDHMMSLPKEMGYVGV